ncbi:MAG: metallophosphoesterase [Candidatus Thorarchaeota archaeon]
MIIAVSDLHLGDPASNRSGFLSFIEEFLKPNREEITDLVLLGDILDLWRKDSSTIIFDNLDVLNEVYALGFHVHYIVGNHDLEIVEFGLGSKNTDNPEGQSYKSGIMTVSDGQLLTNGGTKFRFIHGHQMNYWYALPFYETFSKAMCKVDEGVQGISDVWTILQKREAELSPFMSERMRELSKVQKNQIENKLAGPLEGHSITVEEGVIEDYNLLHDFVEFKGDQTRVVKFLNEAVRSLSLESENIPLIESLTNLGKLTSDATFEEVASGFLNAWIDTFQSVNSNRECMENEKVVQIIGRFQRIAAMFSTDLQHDEFLVHGHGHNNHVDLTNHKADTGCWLGNKGSFISIEDGKVSCTPWSNR